MMPTPEQSAAIKQRFKREPVTDGLRKLATDYPIEYEEACREVRDGHANAAPWSLAALGIEEG